VRICGSQGLLKSRNKPSWAGKIFEIGGALFNPIKHIGSSKNMEEFCSRIFGFFYVITMSLIMLGIVCFAIGYFVEFIVG
jgi:hypothetical protein